MADSLTVSQVSDVDSCSGMSNLDTNKAFEISVPHRIPHVSRLRRVFEFASRRNSWRRLGGRNNVLRGVPFSRYAAGLNVNVDGLRSEGSACDFGATSVSFDGRGGPVDDSLLGRGGGSSIE